MIQVTPHMRVLVAVEPADFRKGIDGLARVCREVLRKDPFSGLLFVFRNNVESRIMWSRQRRWTISCSKVFWTPHNQRLSKKARRLSSGLNRFGRLTLFGSVRANAFSLSERVARM